MEKQNWCDRITTRSCSRPSILPVDSVPVLMRVRAEGGRALLEWRLRRRRIGKGTGARERIAIIGITARTETGHLLQMPDPAADVRADWPSTPRPEINIGKLSIVTIQSLRQLPDWISHRVQRKSEQNIRASRTEVSNPLVLFGFVTAYGRSYSGRCSRPERQRARRREADRADGEGFGRTNFRSFRSCIQTIKPTHATTTQLAPVWSTGAAKFDHRC
jgi:hypothetical protein